MSHLYKLSEWQSPTGVWYVNDTTELAGNAGMWWMPARVLGMKPVEFVDWIIREYEPDNIIWSDNKCFFYSWNEENYNKAHKFLLYVNKVARSRNCIVN